MYVLTLPICTSFWIYSLARSSFDKGSNQALRVFANICHESHGRTLNSSSMHNFVLIQLSTPPDIRVANTSHRSSSRTLLRRIQCDISVNHVVTTGCLSPKSFLGASKFLSVKGLAESPPPTIAIRPTPIGLALLFIAISNGTIGVAVLSQWIGFVGGGARIHNTISSVRVGIEPIGMLFAFSRSPSSCIFFIRHNWFSKST